MQIRNDEKFSRHEAKFANQDAKINLLIDMQIRNDEKFAQHEAKFANQDAKIDILNQSSDAE